ncbi:hypothetical protein [Vibrio harveyi]|uniref:secretion/conjugation apparatus DotM-related subunit n=1 Tax=Vibrio harveyi TaxID=669 RepID=UPI002480AE0D|nr:hypothetical protein [Vibrio harveyi]
MSSHTNNDMIEDIKSLFWIFLALVLIVYFLLFKSDLFFSVWKYIRFAELLMWHYLIDVPFSSNFFAKGVNILWVTPPNEMDWSWLFQFETYYNRYLRFFYSIFFFGIGGKIVFNYFYVTKKLTVQSMIELWRHESEAIETLVHDNPLKSHRIYDFDNRDDFHNRHAQAMSPSQYVSACPPVNASLLELESYKTAIENQHHHSFRPIAIIDRKKNKLKFSRPLAKQSLERQLTNPPVTNPYYNDADNAPRLFDSEGELIPLNYDEQGRVVGGFSQDKLLNNGRQYNGSAEDVALLFNGLEREVFYMLCDRYNHPSIPIEELVLELVEKHAYTRTYLVSFLNLVRKNSNIASTEFYLLQRKDRILYFCMYSATEEKPFYEALGVMAHYHNEIEIGRGIAFPCVDKGVETLQKEAKRLAAWKPDNTDLLTKLAYNLRELVPSTLKREQLTDEELDGKFAALLGNGEYDSSNEQESGAHIHSEVRE